MSPPSRSHRSQWPRGRLTGRGVCLLCPLLQKAVPEAVHNTWAPQPREKRHRRTLVQAWRRDGRGGGPSGSALLPDCGCGRRRAACGLCGGPLSRVWPSRSSHTMITFLLIISRRGSRRGFSRSSCPPDPLRSTARGAFPRPRGPASWTGLTSPSLAEAPGPPSTCGSVAVSVAQLYPTLCDPMNGSPPGSSVHGISQARILQWVASPLSRGSS